MLNNKKKRILKRNLKRIAIVGIPFAILCGITYASIASLSHAGDASNAFKHYYDDPSYTKNSSEYDNINTSTGDSAVGDNNGSNGAVEAITNHDNVVLDTKPESFTVLVNKELRLPSDYIPDDLVVPDINFSFDYNDEKKLMRQIAADALTELFNGAAAENILLNGVSAYRSYDRQYEIFTNNVKKLGLEHTMKYSATPGYSEHQTGLAIDVSAKSVNNRLDESFANSTESKWLSDNAYLYGFIIRYPKDKTEITGYSYEPWHIRYVGKPLAKYLYESNLCLEEYYNFKPSMDYSDQISYDKLADYGIDLADVIEPTRAPTKVPTKAPTKEPEEETADDNTVDDNTVEDGNSTKDDTPTKSPGKPAGGKGDGDNSGNTEDTQDGNTIDDGTPTKPPKGNDQAPTVTPTPTISITPTPILDPENEITPTPTDTPTP